MGIIDTTKFTISCPKCGALESISVYQKGSVYGASWQESVEARHFVLVWTGGNKTEPLITDAKCCSCGTQATFR